MRKIYTKTNFYNLEKVRQELIIKGYELAKVKIRDRHKSVSIKEFWYLYPDSIENYCKATYTDKKGRVVSRGWEIIEAQK